MGRKNFKWDSTTKLFRLSAKLNRIHPILVRLKHSIKKEVLCMAEQFITKNGKLYKVIITPYITKNGKRVYHPKGGYYRFEVEVK
ncbi:hypothetical protein [Sphingobacterium multivorum]|uniref:hypothetical protein n=1 Tax=Sphingobacterium multivorum TaxID=28454 RepID=UPI0031BA9B40